MEQLKKLRQDFEQAVNGYVAAFLKQFELGEHDCWWVGDRIGFNTFCFGDIYALSLDDMIFCVEEGVTYEEYIDYTEYCARCLEYSFTVMNLKAWHKGAPRVPQETFDKLDALKKDLEEAIKNVEEEVARGKVEAAQRGLF